MTRTIPARAAKFFCVHCFRMALFYCISRPVCKRRNPFRGQNRENRTKRQNTPIQLKTAQTGQTGLLGQNRLIRLKTVYSSKTGEISLIRNVHQWWTQQIQLIQIVRLTSNSNKNAAREGSSKHDILTIRIPSICLPLVSFFPTLAVLLFLCVVLVPIQVVYLFSPSAICPLARRCRVHASTDLVLDAK